ncbi:NUDIX domain-containing protein [Mycoplasmatota bacterium WC30]
MYCTICGSDLELRTIVNEGDIPFCRKCDKLFFPRVNLAMIAILTNTKNQICLINQKGASEYKVLLAGYIKPGETLEECVKREIAEEVGLDIIKCEYLNSHYYDKSEVLMVGYHALTNQSNFKIDEDEVDNANWYELDDAIGRIREGSIAYLLVEQYLKNLKIL